MERAMPSTGHRAGLNKIIEDALREKPKKPN
jgi:hypothetical protein